MLLIDNCNAPKKIRVMSALVKPLSGASIAIYAHSLQLWHLAQKERYFGYTIQPVAGNASALSQQI
jgi:hypothetical protein